MPYNQIVGHHSLTPFNFSPQTKIETWIAFDLEWTRRKIDEYAKYNIVENASGASEPPVFGSEEEYNEVVTFAFEDSDGNKGYLDITEFDSTKSFLEAIKEKLLQYQYCFAWGSKAVVKKNRETGKLEGINGDLAVLDSNFKANRIPTIVKYDKYTSVPFLKSDVFTSGKSRLKADIDLFQVFAKPLVRTSILKNKYKSLRLDDVSKALLGYGKLDSKTGAKLDEMSVDERKMYCLQDAHLVAELLKVNNGDVLKIMQVIASHTGLTFEEICHKGMTGIWKKIINEVISKKIKIVGKENMPSTLRNMYSNNVSYTRYTDYSFDETEYDEDDEDEELLEIKENSYDHYIDLLDRKSRNKTSDTVDDYSDIAYSNNNTENTKKPIVKNRYKGGLVLDPLIGLHHDVYLFDITSLYPTMIINNKISPETVNCSCCKHDVNARLVFDKDLLNDLQHGNVTDNNELIYWICKRRRGLFSKILEELTQKRIQYKKENKELKSTAIKAIINSGYGVFGHPHFKYYDPKVAEVITALGRQTLLDMKKIANEMGFSVLYGDTDSLFVNNIKNNKDISKFIDDCKKKLNVSVNHEKTFRKLILVGKKHYIGIPHGDDKPVIKGMEGIKSDRPEFVQTTFREVVKDVQEDNNPIPRLKGGLEELDRRQIPKERLSISLILTKNPQDYVNDCLQKRLGSKLKLGKGNILTYYKSDKQVIIYDKLGKQRTRTFGESDDPVDIYQLA
jgi:DNA polymerase elongation subunit (family B)